MKKIIFSIFVCLTFISCQSEDDSDMASAPIIGEWGIDRYIVVRVDGSVQVLNFQEDACDRYLSMEFLPDGTTTQFMDQTGIESGCAQLSGSGYLHWTRENSNTYEFTYKEDDNSDEFIYLAFVDFPTNDTMVITYDGAPPFVPNNIVSSLEEHYFRK